MCHRAFPIWRQKAADRIPDKSRQGIPGSASKPPVARRDRGRAIRLDLIGSDAGTALSSRERHRNAARASPVPYPQKIAHRALRRSTTAGNAFWRRSRGRERHGFQRQRCASTRGRYRPRKICKNFSYQRAFPIWRQKAADRGRMACTLMPPISGAGPSES